jgi:hypothetical protein
VPVDEVLLEVSARATPAAEVVFERREEDVTVRGAATTGADGVEAGGAETVRPMDGGAAGFDGGEAGLAFGAGLSQEEKKSSSSAPAVGCGAADLEVSTPSTTIPFGNLYGYARVVRLWVADHDRNVAHRIASSFTRRTSSSLYSSATRLEYFFFTSESLSNEAPPCRVKNSVAEPLPPTFIVRSWISCQLSRLVELENCGVRGHATCIGCGRDVPNEGDVHTHIAMHTGTIETDV